MTTTDTSERGLESLIVAAMAGDPVRAPVTGGIGELSALYGGTGWRLGDWRDYDEGTADYTDVSTPAPTGGEPTGG